MPQLPSFAPPTSLTITPTTEYENVPDCPHPLVARDISGLPPGPLPTSTARCRTHGIRPQKLAACAATKKVDLNYSQINLETPPLPRNCFSDVPTNNADRTGRVEHTRQTKNHSACAACVYIILHRIIYSGVYIYFASYIRLQQLDFRAYLRTRTEKNTGPKYRLELSSGGGQRECRTNANLSLSFPPSLAS